MDWFLYDRDLMMKELKDYENFLTRGVARTPQISTMESFATLVFIATKLSVLDACGDPE